MLVISLVRFLYSENSSLVNDKTSYFSRVSMWSSGSVNDLSSNFTSNEQFYDSEGKAFLRIKTYDLTSEGFYANIQNVKTEFYVGDAFSVGDIKIYGTYTAGDDSYEINYYTIDNSELIFDSEGKLSTPMKATVRILVNDIVVASYGVSVKDIEVVDLYAVDSRTSNDSKFYEGDRSGLSQTLISMEIMNLFSLLRKEMLEHSIIIFLYKLWNSNGISLVWIRLIIDLNYHRQKEHLA